MTGILNSSWVQNTKVSNVYEHDICRKISASWSQVTPWKGESSSNPDSIFIPTQSSTEWALFRQHHPAEILLSYCGCLTDKDCEEWENCYWVIPAQAAYCKGTFTHPGASYCQWDIVLSSEFKCWRKTNWYWGSWDNVLESQCNWPNQKWWVFWDKTLEVYSRAELWCLIPWWWGWLIPWDWLIPKWWEATPSWWGLSPWWWWTIVHCRYPCSTYNQSNCNNGCSWKTDYSTIDCNSPITTNTAECHGKTVPSDNVKCYYCEGGWNGNIQNGITLWHCALGGPLWGQASWIEDCMSRGGKAGFLVPSWFPNASYLYEVKNACFFQDPSTPIENDWGHYIDWDYPEGYDDRTNRTCRYPCGSFDTLSKCNQQSQYCERKTSSSTPVVDPIECSKRNWCTRVNAVAAIPGTCRPPQACGRAHWREHTSLSAGSSRLCNRWQATNFGTSIAIGGFWWWRSWKCGAASCTATLTQTNKCWSEDWKIFYNQLDSPNSSNLCVKWVTATNYNPDPIPAAMPWWKERTRNCGGDSCYAELSPCGQQLNYLEGDCSVVPWQFNSCIKYWHDETSAYCCCG